MRNVQYFQWYDQKENWVTNSTLLLLSRLYHYSRVKFENVINGILSESNITLSIGVGFRQQEKGKHSVADGIIEQNSFKILIETKLYDNFTSDQLRRHLDGLKGQHEERVLLALSKGNISNGVREEVTKHLKLDEYKNIKLASTTFEALISSIRETLSDYDFEMQEILNEYAALCKEHSLLSSENHTMPAFTAGFSLPENFKFNLYYDPATRSHNIPFTYIGLYKDKGIRAVGKLSKIVYCDYEDGKLIQPTDNNVTLTKDEYTRIKEVIETTDYYDLSYGNKFFLVDRFYETEFIKTSFSSIRAKKYFFLNELEGFKEGMSASELAKLLDGKEWE